MGILRTVVNNNKHGNLNTAYYYIFINYFKGLEFND